jgi:hypothetical protein
MLLPPDERNDELGDFFQRITNAEPKDEQAIRAEIKRYYYDAGDTSAGDALNAALSNVLGPGVQRKDRQKILDEIGPYSQSDADDQKTQFWIGLGLLVLSMAAPPVEFAAVPEAASVAVEASSLATRMVFRRSVPQGFLASIISNDRRF